MVATLPRFRALASVIVALLPATSTVPPKSLPVLPRSMLPAPAFRSVVPATVNEPFKPSVMSPFALVTDKVPPVPASPVTVRLPLNVTSSAAVKDTASRTVASFSVTDDAEVTVRLPSAPSDSPPSAPLNDTEPVPAEISRVWKSDTARLPDPPLPLLSTVEAKTTLPAPAPVLTVASEVRRTASLTRRLLPSSDRLPSS